MFLGFQLALRAFLFRISGLSLLRLAGGQRATALLRYGWRSLSLSQAG